MSVHPLPVFNPRPTLERVEIGEGQYAQVIDDVLLNPEALVDLALDPERRRAFGGLARAALSVVVETVFSTLHAPLQMLWHTRFVITILLGMGLVGLGMGELGDVYFYRGFQTATTLWNGFRLEDIGSAVERLTAVLDDMRGVESAPKPLAKPLFDRPMRKAAGSAAA